MIGSRVVTILSLVLISGILSHAADGPCTLRGRVLGFTGAPLEGVRVLAAGYLEGEGGRAQLVLHEAETGPGGAFTLACPGSETLILRAETPGWAPATLRRPHGPQDIVVRLYPGVLVQGVLLDARDRRPLAGGQVDLSEMVSGEKLPEEIRGFLRRRVTTGADGKFYFERTPEGVHRIEARVPGFSTQASPALAVSYPPALPPALTLLMAPGQRVLGTVLDTEGNPLEGIQVSAQARLGDLLAPSTDAEGKFEIGESFSEVVALKAGGDGFVTALKYFKPSPGEDPFEQVFTLQKAVPARVQLKDEAGRPVTGPVEWVFHDEAEKDAGFYPLGFPYPNQGEESVPPDGILVLKGLPPGEGRLFLRPRGLVGRSLAVPVGQGPLSRDLGAAVFGQGSRLHGRVRDDRGEPVPHASVDVTCIMDEKPEDISPERSWSEGEAETEDSGRFSISGLIPESTCHVWVAAPKHTNHTLAEIKPGPAELEITLTRAGRVQATLRDDRTLQPLTVFEIEGHGIFQDPSGMVLLEEMDPGETTLSFRAPGRVTRSLDAEVKPGETTDLGLLLLKRGARVDGRVVEAESGAGVPAARVRVLSGPGDWGFQGGYGNSGEAEGTLSGPDGEFGLEGLIPGSYRLAAEAEGFVESLQSLRIEDGESWALWTLPLEKGGSLAVTVEDEEGAPVTSCLLKVLAQSGGEQRQHLTNAEGRAKITDLGPGAVALRSHGMCSSRAGTPAGVVHWTGEVRRGETTEITLRPQPPRIPVSGRVRRGDQGIPARLSWVPAGGPEEISVRPIFIVSEADGHYQGYLPQGGAYSVTADLPGLAPASVVVADPEGVVRDFEIPGDGSLRGRLVDARTGKPMGFAGVIVFELTEGNILETTWIGDDLEESGPGEFLFEGLPLGRVGIKVIAWGDVPIFLGTYEIKSGQDLDLGTIAAGAHPVCRLKVEDQGQNQVAGAVLYRVLEGGAWIQETASTRTGKLEFIPGNEEGFEWVVVREGYVPAWLTALNCASGVGTVRLETGLSVTLEVRDAQEAPVPALVASLKDERGRPVSPTKRTPPRGARDSLTTNAGGQIHLEDLGPGSYRAEFKNGRQTVASGSFRIRPGRPTHPVFRTHR